MNADCVVSCHASGGPQLARIVVVVDYDASLVAQLDCAAVGISRLGVRLERLDQHRADALQPLPLLRR